MKSDFLYQNSFVFWLTRLSAVMQEKFNHTLQRLDVTWSQWLVLNFLKQRVNATPAEVARAIGVDRSAVTRLVDRLEAKKLVTRVREGLDRRSISLYLTKDGLDISQRIDEAARQHESDFLKSLHSSERRMLKGEVQKMLRVGGVETSDIWRLQ